MLQRSSTCWALAVASRSPLPSRSLARLPRWCASPPSLPVHVSESRDVTAKLNKALKRIARDKKRMEDLEAENDQLKASVSQVSHGSLPVN